MGILKNPFLKQLVSQDRRAKHGLPTLMRVSRARQRKRRRARVLAKEKQGKRIASKKLALDKREAAKIALKRHNQGTHRALR
jgi:hypothetical protein